MYQVYFDKHLIYDPRVKGLLIRNTDLKLTVNEAGSFGFTVDSDHPMGDILSRLKGELELRSDDSVIYRGRIIRDSRDFNLSRPIKTEGALAYLNDSVIPPFNFPEDFEEDADYVAAAETGNVIAFFLGWLLQQHNSQVLDDRKIFLGDVTVSDPNNYFSRDSTEYASTWETIKSKLFEGSLGGYVLPRYETNGTYLDYFSELPLTNTQRVKYAENLLDLQEETDCAETYSIILPLGADGLTVESLPDGDIDDDLVKKGRTVYSKSAIEDIGRITKQKKWDDVTDPENLLSKSSAMLKGSGIYASKTINATAYDLHCSSKEVESFRVGRTVLLDSAPHGYDIGFPLMGLDLDILDPASAQITMGAKAMSQTQLQQKQHRQELEIVEALEKKINKDVTGLSESVTTLSTSILQSCEDIVMEATKEYVLTGDFETYQQKVSTQFSQTAEEFKFLFESVDEKVDGVNGDLQSKYNERVKYIRFVDGNIVLGEEGNEITLVQSNDRISFMQKGKEVAYFANNKLYVTEGEFLQLLKIGKFEFVPRNDGGLGFRKAST